MGLYLDIWSLQPTVREKDAAKDAEHKNGTYMSKFPWMTFSSINCRLNSLGDDWSREVSTFAKNWRFTGTSVWLLAGPLCCRSLCFLTCNGFENHIHWAELEREGRGGLRGKGGCSHLGVPLLSVRHWASSESRRRRERQSSQRCTGRLDPKSSHPQTI